MLFILVSMLCISPTVVSPLFFFPRSHQRLGGSGHLDGLLDAVGLGRGDFLARLGNLGEDRLVGEVGDDLGGLVLEGDFVALDACGTLAACAPGWRGKGNGEEHTVKLLEDAVDGAGAAAAGHCDVELVGVRSHCAGFACLMRGRVGGVWRGGGLRCGGK